MSGRCLFSTTLSDEHINFKSEGQDKDVRARVVNLDIHFSRCLLFCLARCLLKRKHSESTNAPELGMPLSL